MLVLTRKPGEVILIGDGIRLEVLEMKGGRVRLGITAPREVAVHRAEVIVTVDPPNRLNTTTKVARSA